MAGSNSNVYPNIVDWARSVDPDGTPALIAEMLSQCNEVLKDLVWQEGNLPLGHKTSVRAGLPQGTWRGNNQGVASTKSLYAQFQDAIGELVDYSEVDKSLAELNGDVAKYRYNEDMGHIEGLSQQIASGIFYLNEATTPNGFTGLSPRYSTVNTATAKNAVNVLDAGGTGSSNCSIWLVGWGDNTIFGIFPKGTPAGLVYEDKGDVTPLYDANGNRFEGYTSYFKHKIGLCVKDWRHGVRIANIDTTSAGLFGVAPPDLYALMTRAVVKLPTASRRLSGITESDAPGDPVPGTSPTWYTNRTGRESLDLQAIRDKNVLIGKDDYAGQPIMTFRDSAVRVCDALTTTEARVV